jgi:hypothetical protein
VRTGIRTKSWYTSSIWLLPIAIVFVSFLLSHIFSNQPPRLAPSVVSLATNGPNLLENGDFSRGLSGWQVYHNAQPMDVSARDRRAVVRPGSTINSVQEIFQTLSDAPNGQLVARGVVRISGAPLSTGSSIVVLVVDSLGQTVAKFELTTRSGLGQFPFAFTYTPSKSTPQFLLAVETGNVPSPRTIITFKNLKIARSKN